MSSSKPSEPSGSPAAPTPVDPARGRKGRRSGFLVASVAGLILAGAGYVIFHQARDLSTELYAPPAASSGPPARSNFQIILGHPDRSELAIGRAGGQTVVSLTRNHPDGPDPLSGAQTILGRELLRQTVLIAAREGLGASIRDEMIGEPAPPGGGTKVLEYRFKLLDSGTGQAALLRPEPEDRADDRTAWSDEITDSRGSKKPLGRIVERLEPFSRGGPLEVLKKEGVVAAPRGGPVVSEVPADAARALDRMTFVSQFAALRSLAVATRSGPASAGQLGAMARAYANLGLLSRNHWNAIHAVFDARALLYSQRLVALHPDAPESYRDRAYVRGVIGLHAEALADLAEAEARAGRLPADRRPAAPAWAALTRPLCESDTAGLMDAASDPARAPLATIFALITVEGSDAAKRAIAVATAAQGANPDCLWVNDESSRILKLGHLHASTLDGLARFDRAVLPEIRRLPGLPAEVARRIDAHEGEVRVAAALAEAGAAGLDPVEPSWAVLGRMAREARFVQVARRVEFMATQWSVPVEEFLDQARPLASDHPFWPALLVQATAPAQDHGAALAGLRKLPLDDLEWSEDFFIQTVRRFARGVAGQDSPPLDFLIRLHTGWTARDWRVNIQQLASDPTGSATKNLFAISPDSPTALVLLIAGNWELARKHRPDLETRYARQPEVLVAIGKHHAAEKRLDDAERAFAAAIRLSPDLETFRALAAVQKEAGRLDRWRETLDAFLDESDPGLDHATVQVELARHFMGRKEYDQARPYAEAAAQTWAGWAMQCAAECAEAMGDHDGAEAWFSRMAERYASASAVWFFFCVRTGHGDRAAAAVPMERYIASVGETTDPAELNGFGAFCVLIGDHRRAVDFYKKAFDSIAKDPKKSTDRFFAGLDLAVSADAVGDAGLRDRTLDDMASAFETTSPAQARACRAIREGLPGTKGGKIDLGPIDALMARLDAKGRGDLGYYFGRLAEQHGWAEKAPGYYRCVAESPDAWPLIKQLAADALRGRKAETGTRR